MERTAAEIPVVISPALNCEWRWLTAVARLQLRTLTR